MRVAFLGNAPWSVPSLEALAGSSHEVALVATRGPRPAGRGGKLTPTPVAQTARSLELPLQEVQTVKSGRGFDALASSSPDVLAVVAYREILPRPVLDIPRVAPVNVHFSLLPELRGAAPVQRAILEGLAVTGVTTIWMDEGMDTGPVLLRQAEAIDPEDDAGALGERLAALGGRLLVDTLDRLEAGAIREEPQDEALATHAPKLTAEEEWIDWTRGADAVVRQVRALAPAPGARTGFRGRTLKVFRAQARGEGLPAGSAEPPGAVVPFRGEDGPALLGVSAGDGRVVVLRDVALEGRRRMSGKEFVRGHRPEPGEILGA